MTRWIQDWVGAAGTGGRAIELSSRRRRIRAQTRRLPATAPASYFTDGSSRSVHTLVTTYCADCHRSTATTKQSPFFAAADRPGVVPRPRSRRSTSTNPSKSRFVIRLGRESHNCWSDCADQRRGDAGRDPDDGGRDQPSQVDPNLITSKALTLFDGTVASGGNRYENNLIALYEFKSGQGGDRVRHQRRRSGGGPHAQRRRHLGRRLGHQHPRRQGAGLDDREPQVPAADHGDRRVLHRSVGRAGQRDAGRRAHRQLLRQHDGPQLHDGPDAVQLRLLRPQHHHRCERHAAVVDRAMPTSACRLRCSTS